MIVCKLTFALVPQDTFGVRSIRNNNNELMGAVYLQVSIISQALIFVTRSRSWSFVEPPGALLMVAFLIAQLVRPSELYIFEVFLPRSYLFSFIESNVQKNH